MQALQIYAGPLGYLGAFLSNAVSRKAMGHWLERVVFSAQGAELPFHTHDYRTRLVALTATNFMPAVQASCSIPFMLQAVHDIPGGPSGAYWDGGITDTSAGNRRRWPSRVARSMCAHPRSSPSSAMPPRWGWKGSGRRPHVLDIPPHQMARVEALQVPTREGDELHAELVMPHSKGSHESQADKPWPVLLYLHGGGFNVGSVATHS